jgi:hypothetical protein
METAHGISLCNYFCLKLAKMPCFSYFYVFSSTKWENRKVEQVGGGIGTGGSGEMVGKKGRRNNTVQIMYTHASKCKNDTC